MRCLKEEKVFHLELTARELGAISVALGRMNPSIWAEEHGSRFCSDDERYRLFSDLSDLVDYP